MTIRVAIVGSGPAGFYAADALLRSEAGVRIDLIDRLPTPFGLVRSGVAPDHQKTKRITQVFLRILADPAVRFYGHVDIGADISLDELRASYDAVVLAVGAPRDRRLGIPGDDTNNVFGSGAFVGWYNGHPDFHDLDPNLDVSSTVVVGNGNVALDIARVLVKSPAEMASSDMAPAIQRRIQESPLREVHILGRRGPAQAKFSNPELAEMTQLADARTELVPPDVPDAPPDGLDARDQRRAAKNLAVFRELAGHAPPGARRCLRFRFWRKPVEVLGEETVTGLRAAETRFDADGRLVEAGRSEVIPCGLLISAIGYRAPELAGLALDPDGVRLAHEEGRVAPGLYCVGWCRRGPTGTIGTNKADGDAVARRIGAEVTASGKPGGAGLESLLTARGVRWVDAKGWDRLDAAERAAAASEEAPRRKFVRIADMLAELDLSKQTSRES